MREISILRSLKHPNIIDVVDIAIDDGQRRVRDMSGQSHEELSDNVYMVMEYAQQVGPPTPKLESAGLGCTSLAYSPLPCGRGLASFMRSKGSCNPS